MVPNSNQRILITDNNTYNYPIQTMQTHQSTVNTRMHTSHSQVKVSFNNGQSSAILNNFTNKN
jgi:hypothetical protein